MARACYGEGSYVGANAGPAREDETVGTERVLIAGGGIADLSLDLAQRGGHLLLDALTRKLSNLND